MPAIYRSMFAINDINNGKLSAIKAMPQKDSTSDGDSTFSVDRRAYVKTYTNNLTNKANPPGHFGMGNHIRPTVFDGNQTAAQKKWSGNRDASEVVRRQRVNSVGVGSLNAQNQPMCFQTHSNINTTRDALRRVRAGGATVPKKVTKKLTNAPVPGYPAGILVRTINHSVAVIHPKMAMAKKPISANMTKHFR
jgi:hypothetical protein